MIDVIKSSAYLRNHYHEISKQWKQSQDAIIITVNGRCDTEILGLQDYYQKKSELELLRILAEAEHDVHDGSMAPMQKSLDELPAFLIATKPK